VAVAGRNEFREMSGRTRRRILLAAPTGRVTPPATRLPGRMRRVERVAALDGPCAGEVVGKGAMFRTRTNKGIRAVALAPDGRLALLHQDRARVCRLGAGGRLVTEYWVAGLPGALCVSGSRAGVAFAPDGALRLLLRGPFQRGSELWGLERGGAGLVARIDEETLDHCFDPARAALALWGDASPGGGEKARRARDAGVGGGGGRRLVEWAAPARGTHTLCSADFRSLHPARGERGIVLLYNITQRREAVIEVGYQAGQVVRRGEWNGCRYTVGPGRLSPCGRWIQTTG